MLLDVDQLSRDTLKPVIRGRQAAQSLACPGSEQSEEIR